MSLTPFGKAISHLRIDLGLSQGDIAKRIGVSPSFISQIERGHKPISRKHVQRVIHAMELSEDQASQVWIAAQASRPPYVRWDRIREES